jgi:trehalose 6-phosphate phosphatase
MRKIRPDLMTAVIAPTDPRDLAPPPAPASLTRNRGPLALFLDLDGVLAPIESRPEDVGPDPRRSRLLDALTEALDGRVAVLSGRALADVDRILEGRVIPVAGVHGLERRSANGRVETLGAEADVALAVEGLTRTLSAEIADGVEIENKGVGVAVHYRNAPDRAAGVRHATTTLARDHGLHLQPGHMVIELKGGDADKGRALAAFLTEPPFAGAHAVMIGDDRTDEAAFRAAEAAGGFGILVDPRWVSAARYGLADTRAVTDWLTQLAEAAR